MVLYSVEVTRGARREIRNLPGNMRQRILTLLKALQENPRPSKSQQMDLSKFEIQLAEDTTLYRIRIESWRVIYALEENIKLLTVLVVFFKNVIGDIPESTVYLAADGNKERSVCLGDLKLNAGNHRMPVPFGMDTTPYNAVMVLDKKSEKEIAFVQL